MRVKIIDIAKKAGVSTGTVDRVLHKRGNVSREKQMLVEKAIKELEYEPNVLASVLASKKRYTLAAIVPAYSEGSDWELACKGIQMGEEEMKKFNTKVEMHFFNQYDTDSFDEAAQTLLKKEYDGVIIATLFEKQAITLSQQLDSLEIPYIYIDSDIPNQNNIAYYGSDTYVSGKIAARLMLDSANDMQTIFFAHIKFKYSAISVQMKNRERGFMHYLNDADYKGRIEHIEIDPDNYQKGLQELSSLLESSQYPVGGIVLNSRYYELAPVLNKLPKHLQEKLYMLGHDAIPGNVAALKENEIEYLLSQRTDLQGYEAVKALSNYILFKEKPHRTNFMPIDILLAENVAYYYNLTSE